MKCQILFSRKNKINFSNCRLLKFLPSMQSIKGYKYTLQGCISIRIGFASLLKTGLFKRQEFIPLFQIETWYAGNTEYNSFLLFT